jgi:hypothetical protein
MTVLHFFVEHTYTTMVLMCSFVQLKMANFGLRDLCLEKTYLNQSIHIYIYAHHPKSFLLLGALQFTTSTNMQY